MINSKNSKFLIQPMIKQLCIRLCILLITVSGYSAYSQQITIGAKTGVNLNQFSQPGTTVGLNVGIYGAYQVLPFLKVKLEPQYSQEGGGRPDYYRDYSSISENVSSITFINPSVRFHNLQVPLLAELTLPEFAEETIAPKLILGASYALSISSKENHTKRYDFIDNTLPGSSPFPLLDVSYQRDNVIDNYKRNQMSLWFGMGLDFKTGGRTCSFDVRYRQGITDLNQLRFASPGNFSTTKPVGVPGTGGKLYSSSVSFNFSMSIFNF
jgi:hypothetical protein